MRWTPGSSRADVDDLRGQGGGRMRMPGGGRLGSGGFVVLLLRSVVFRKNFFALLGGDAGPVGQPGVSAPAPGTTSPEEEQLADFVTFVLNDVQDTWTKEFARSNLQYERARLVLFTDAVRSGCGYAEAAMGPFYCPADHRAYVDLGFYRELKNRFGAPGDFAQAYVLAHEIGHHVQNLLGVANRVRGAQQEDPSAANELSVRMELQADCFAGIWAHSTSQRRLLEQGDIEEGLAAAAAVGDDRIQAQATGRVNPETWTHGSSEQRARWFRAGLETGNVDNCDTFASGR
jgi:uncharacterized protein